MLQLKLWLNTVRSFHQFPRQYLSGVIALVTILLRVQLQFIPCQI